MILLVDDDVEVLKITQMILNNLGYKVKSTLWPTQAIGILYEKAKQIELLITDVVMPGMCGSQMYRKMLLIKPSLKVLFMSGYGPETLSKLLDEEHICMNKPMSMQALDQAVKNVINSN